MSKTTNGSRRTHRDFRPLLVSNGRTLYPLVCRVNVREILFHHHGSKTEIPVPWRQFIQAGARAAGVSEEDFLRTLLAQCEQSPQRPQSPDLTETAHAAPGRDALPTA
jgi:hypothetical protein